MDNLELRTERTPRRRASARMPAPVTSPAALPPFTPELAAELAPLYARVKHIVTPMEWPHYAPLIKAINELKKERNAVILAHNYMTPEIFHCVGDFQGDSLQLAKEAARTTAQVIVQAGVHFMAETSKLLNPDKTVLIPDLRAGCSLAASITAADVRMLREAYPGVPIVTYVNTSAAVKAECDICCTSSNAVKIVESLGAPRVLLIPDEYLAKYVQTKTKVEIIAWKGHCEVHERFTAQDIADIRAADPGTRIIAHPECPPEVIEASDFTGSTSAMINWVKTNRPKKVALITECSMASNVAVETPDVEFIRPCSLCPHMKLISLENIYLALRDMRHEVTVDPAVAAKARRAVERMVNLTN
jgi:quinolinate synthase